MKRFILTGTPGSGKTAILRQLELDGFSVVEEAATDVIALWQARGIDEAWKDIAFIDAIADLQRQRQLRAEHAAGVMQFHDRSAICTAALAHYLGFPVTELLGRELARIRTQDIFQRRVFFVRNLGFVAPTEARRINYEEALRFERIHEDTYREFGYEIVSIEPASLDDRVSCIKALAEEACVPRRVVLSEREMP
jgi:predicted ATPase